MMRGTIMSRRRSRTSGSDGAAPAASSNTARTRSRCCALIRVLAVPGALLGLSGVVIWARYSLTRYLRYWLLRVIFEERLQQDRTIEVLERIEAKLDREI